MPRWDGLPNRASLPNTLRSMAEVTSSLLAVSKAFRSRLTMVEMLKDRGFIVTSEQECSNLDDFKARFLSANGSIVYDSMFLMCGHAANIDDKVYVFFSGEESVNSQKVKEWHARAKTELVGTALVVMGGKVNPAARKYAAELARAPDFPVNFQLFEEDLVVINVTKHELVPKHIPLSPEETQEMLSKYNLQLAQLPRILVSDPQIQYFGLQRGRVVKIVRTSETAGEYVTYRQVV